MALNQFLRTINLADTIAMNNQWRGQEAFWISFADDGKWIRATYQKKEAMPIKLIPA